MLENHVLTTISDVKQYLRIEATPPLKPSRNPHRQSHPKVLTTSTPTPYSSPDLRRRSRAVDRNSYVGSPCRASVSTNHASRWATCPRAASAPQVGGFSSSDVISLATAPSALTGGAANLRQTGSAGVKRRGARPQPAFDPAQSQGKRDCVEFEVRSSRSKKKAFRTKLRSFCG